MPNSSVCGRGWAWCQGYRDAGIPGRDRSRGWQGEWVGEKRLRAAGAARRGLSADTTSQCEHFPASAEIGFGKNSCGEMKTFRCRLERRYIHHGGWIVTANVISLISLNTPRTTAPRRAYLLPLSRDADGSCQNVKHYCVLQIRKLSGPLAVYETQYYKINSITNVTVNITLYRLHHFTLKGILTQFLK